MLQEYIIYGSGNQLFVLAVNEHDKCYFVAYDHTGIAQKQVYLCELTSLNLSHI